MGEWDSCQKSVRFGPGRKKVFPNNLDSEPPTRRRVFGYGNGPDILRKARFWMLDGFHFFNFALSVRGPRKVKG